MRPNSRLFALVAVSAGQTPPGYWPHTSMGLDVAFHHYQLTQPGELVLPNYAVDPPTLGRQGLDVFVPCLAVMIDVEVNHAGTATPLLHWLQSDLRVHDPITGRLTNHSDDGAPYVGPQPVPGPRHTYVLLLFAQPRQYSFPECFSSVLPITVEARAGFDLAQFMTFAGLQEPIAANYFTAQNEEKPSEPPSIVATTSLSTAPCRTPTSFAWA